MDLPYFPDATPGMEWLKVKQHPDGGTKSVCERLRERGSAGVGVGTVFIS